MKSMASWMILGALVLAGCAITTGRFDPARQSAIGTGDGDFKFIVIGDTRPDGHLPDKTIQPEAFFANIARANSYDHDFVVDIGDLVLGYCETDLLLRQWDAFDEAIKRFEKPFVMVIGNHDVSTDESEKIWLDRYGPLYFSWEHAGAHFIALDSDKIGELDNIKGDQLEWLKTDLEAAKDARRVFVFVHKPLWAYDASNWTADVHPLLARYGVDTVFAGHWHEYCLHPTKDGVRYVVTGGGGAEIGDAIGDFHHFLVVSVTGQSSDFKVVTPTEELPPEIVTWAVRQAIASAMTVKPVAKPAKDGTVSIVIEIHNPLPIIAGGLAILDGKGTSWKSAKAEISIQPADTTRVELATVITGDVFPLPKLGVQVHGGRTRIVRESFFPDVRNLVADLPQRPIDDFEDGDLKNLAGTNGIAGANGEWLAKCDEYGESRMEKPVVESVEIEGRKSRVFHVSGFHGTSADPKWCWASVEGWVAGAGVSVDLTPSVGISFKARSATESNMRIMAEGTVAGKRLAAKGAAYCKRLTIGKEWKTYTIYWYEMKQEPWVCPGPDCVEGPLTVDKVEYFNFGFRDEGKSFDLFLDDVALIYEKK